MNVSPANTRSRLQRFIRSPYFILALLTLVCHGLLLVTDYKIWDGWLVENWQRNERFDVMWRQYSEAGIQHHYLIHRLFGLSAHSVWLYKIASVLAYYGMACAYFRLTLRTKFLDRHEALISSAFVVTFPGMLTLGEAAVFPYVLGMFLFFSAGCIAVHSEFQSGLRYGLNRLLAVTLFLLAFSYYATVVYYLAFYLLFLWFLWHHESLNAMKAMGLIVAKRLDYLLLPVAFWMLKLYFMAPFGFYADYNRPRFDFETFTACYESLIKTILTHALDFQFNLLVVAGVVGGGFLLAKRLRFDAPNSYRRCTVLSAAGLFFLALGGFPFAIVGKPFAAYGYSSNYSLFIPVGMGLLLTALLGGLRLLLARDNNGIVVKIAFGYLLASYIGAWTNNYLSWQALGVRDQSVARKLGASDAARVNPIFIIIDQFQIPQTDNFPYSVRGVQMQEAFQDRKHFGFEISGSLVPPNPSPMSPDALERVVEMTGMRYFFSEVNLNGSQALLWIRPGKVTGQPTDLALRYLARKSGILGQSDGIGSFLDELTDVTMIPIAQR